MFSRHMRSNEIFAAMSGEEALGFLEEMRSEAPEVAKIALAAAAEAFRLRPEFLKRQPRPRQAEWMRRALGRTIGAPLAEEVLATYFLENELDLLIELLDALGVEHDEGKLAQEEPTCPEPKALEKAVQKFLGGSDKGKRQLLLHAFAAQSSVEWPDLEALVEGTPRPAPVKAPAAKAKAKAKAAAPKAAAARKKAAPKKAKAKPKKAKAKVKKAKAKVKKAKAKAKRKK